MTHKLGIYPYQIDRARDVEYGLVLSSSLDLMLDLYDVKQRTKSSNLMTSSENGHGSPDSGRGNRLLKL